MRRFVSGTVAFAGLGLLMAGTLRAEVTLALANLLFLVSLVLGGIVAAAGPAARRRRVGRRGPSAGRADPHAVLGLGSVPGDATEPLVILVGWAVLFAVLAARWFRWD